jgi:peptide/nickel transport system substrate-binding protein
MVSIRQTDPKTITFELKPGFKWVNGQGSDWKNDFGELTAEDVKYTVEHMKVSDYKDKYATVDGVEITGTYSGVIHMNQAFAPLWYTTLADGSGSILCKQAVEAAGGKFQGLPPAMCGPYVVSDWAVKQHIVLTPNPMWTGPKPGIPKVTILIVEDDKAAEIGYEAGELDITDTSVDSMARIQAAPPPDSAMTIKPGLRWTWMGMNTDHPKLKDIRVRKAIQRAVDPEEVVAAAWGGIAPIAHGIVPPGLIGHRAASKFKHDPDEARSLLADAGADGLELTLQVLNKTDTSAAAQVIQANLADVGINVEVVPLDPGPFWSLGIESKGDDWKDLQLWIMRFGDAPDPSQDVQWYVSSQVGVWNWERWKDPEFDELAQKGLAETDEAKRNEIYLRMQEIMEDTGAYAWLCHEPVPLLYKADLEPAIYPSSEPMLPWFKWKA